MSKPDSRSRDEWIGQAKCRGMDTKLFFPSDEKKNGSSPRHYAPEAIEACKSCPVLEQCQEWAVLHEAYGYQGGLTPAQRARVRSRLNIILWEPQLNMSIGGNYQPRQTNSPIQHGTRTGYRQERQRGMAPCEECLKAHRNSGQASQAS